METCLDLLICPLCAAHLALDGNSLRCPNNHTFDVARSGYVNLYLAGRRQRKHLGDSKEMLLARRRLLESGAYAPLVAAVQQQVLTHVQEHPQRRGVLLDVGSGEGYYTGSMAAALTDNFPERSFCFFGLDLAKDGVQMAAKRYRDIRFLVADVKQQIPLAGQTVDVLLNIFAPRDEAAFARVTAPGGLLLVIIPAADHLQRLRQRFDLLDIEEDKRQHVLQQFAPSFTHQHVQRLAFPLTLTNESLLYLVQMSPSARHLTSAQRQALLAAPPVTAKASLELLSFRRKNGAGNG